MREIKVAICFDFPKDTNDPSVMNVLDRVVRLQEANLNRLGGIAGIPVKISFEFHNSDVEGEDLLENLVEKGYHIALDLPTQILRRNPDFPNKFGGLLFCDVDPVEPIHAPNLFDINRELLDNRQFVGFVASQLHPVKVILLQVMTTTITERSFGRYENVLKENGWSGQFCPFPISEKDHEIINTDERDSENYKEVVGNLRSRLDNLIDEWDRRNPILVVSNLNYFSTNWFLNDYLIATRAEFGVDEDTLVHVDLSSTAFDMPCLSRKKQFHLDEAAKPLHQEYINELRTAKIPYEDDVHEAIEFVISATAPLAVCWHVIPHETDLDIPSLLKTVIEELNQLGIDRTWLYAGRRYAFQNNVLATKSTYIYRTRQGYSEITEQFQWLDVLFEKQPELSGSTRDVIYLNADLRMVLRVDVSDKVWVGEMELEFNSPVADPIKYIKFLNQSPTNDIWNVKQVRENEVSQRFQTKYHLVGAFSMSSTIDEFPFDTQTLELRYCLDRNADTLILQAPLDSMVKRDFEIDGWLKKQPIDTGFESLSEWDRTGVKQTSRVHIARDYFVRWNIARQDTISLLRSLIPLLVMMVLAWYSSFNGPRVVFETIQINTTVFLAGVALYFSAEKPRGASFTFIDRMFIYFYVAIGLQILSEFTLMIDERLYQITHLVWQVSIPFAVAIFLVIVWRKVKAIST